MYVWPRHFPDGCPPTGATELQGVVFRFVNSNTPKEKDFVSYYDRAPSTNWAKPCQARGLSVVRTLEDCETMCVAIPALRKKHIAKANIESSVGLIAITPSDNCDAHCTWWRATHVNEVHSLFSVIGKCTGVA